MSYYLDLEGACEFYNGLPRSTKTLKMVMDAVNDHILYGRILVLNFHLKKLPFIYKRVPDLINWISETTDDKHYTLCIDEIQNEADGRDFASWTNKDFSKFIAQCGKRNIKIKYASQFGGGAELRLRQITDRVTYCTAIRDPTDKNPMTNLLAGVYETWQREPRRPIRKPYIISREVFSLYWGFYNTRELILPFDMQERHNDLIEIETTGRKVYKLKAELKQLERRK